MKTDVSMFFYATFDSVSYGSFMHTVTFYNYAALAALSCSNASVVLKFAGYNTLFLVTG